jgi:hypothetical protein
MVGRPQKDSRLAPSHSSKASVAMPPTQTRDGFVTVELELITLNFASWNRVVSWLRQLEVIRAAA